MNAIIQNLIDHSMKDLAKEQLRRETNKGSVVFLILKYYHAD